MNRHVATLLSLGNVAAGIAAAALFMRDVATFPLVLLVLAGVFDVMDGWAARRAGESNPLGKWIDTVADMISFGIVPGVMLLHLIPDPRIAWTLAVPYVLAMGFRLLRFSRADAPRDRWFLGLPSPAAAIAVAGACQVVIAMPEWWMLASVTVWVFAAAAVSRIPYPKGSHPSLNRLPRLLSLLIWVVHAVLFVLASGWAALSLMTIYLVFGPVLLRGYFREQAS